MPSVTSREPRPSLAERRRQRRGELLEAAIDVIRRRGADVTMEEMASAGGISKPILYRHFADRDGLVSAITETALVEIGSIIDGKLRDVRAEAPLDSIRATIDAFFEYVEREPHLYRFIVDSDVRRGNVVAAFAERIAARVAETLADGLVESGFDPAPASIWGRAIVGMVQNTATWWTGDTGLTREEAVAALTNLVWVGIVGSVADVPAELPAAAP
jgi:AcrR family transcriptional regulator